MLDKRGSWSAPILKLVAIFAWCALLIGCSRQSLEEQILPDDIVLLDASKEINAQALEVRPHKPIISKGDVSICLVLATNIEYDTTARVNERYERSLSEGRPVALLTARNGKKYRFMDPKQVWTAYGRVTKRGELSTCLSPQGAPLPEGVHVELIELSSDKPLEILGAYWSSGS